MKIGVISDTHNYLDPKVLKLFSGVEHILHGGDIGLPLVLSSLREIAPVTAVMGNTDDSELRYNQTELIELAERKFLLHHIVNPLALDDAMVARISEVRPEVVIFGHTHKPFNKNIDGTLFFNPGYAGQSRFGMERSVAILHCGKKEIRAHYFSL